MKPENKTNFLQYENSDLKSTEKTKVILTLVILSMD
jgi:hypothetical protein